MKWRKGFNQAGIVSLMLYSLETGVAEMLILRFVDGVMTKE